MCAAAKAGCVECDVCVEGWGGSSTLGYFSTCPHPLFQTIGGFCHQPPTANHQLPATSLASIIHVCMCHVACAGELAGHVAGVLLFSADGGVHAHGDDQRHSCSLPSPSYMHPMGKSRNKAKGHRLFSMTSARFLGGGSRCVRVCCVPVRARCWGGGSRCVFYACTHRVM